MAAGVSDEAVDAAARAQWNNWRGCRWEHGYPDDQQRIRDYARVDLEAAAPLLRAEALREWIAEWPTVPGDGTFLADVARDGLSRADRIEASDD